MMTLPNKLVFARIAIAFLVIIGFCVLPLENIWLRLIITLLFVLACFTDWLDGYIARTRDEHTDFGEAFDAIADKMLVTPTLIFLAISASRLLLIPVCFIIIRDLAVDGIRMIHAKTGTPIAAGKNGKTKTFVQMSLISVAIFLWHPYLTAATIIVSFGLSAWSGITYIRESKLQLHK